jgi:hypothetical protein
MSLSAVECPNGVCHSFHGGHTVARTDLDDSLQRHGRDWCERLAERVYELSVDSFSQSVTPHLHQPGWQRRHLDWEFRLQGDGAEPERTVVDGAINAVESFLRSHEVQRLFVRELVQGTLAATGSNGSLRAQVLQQLIERELLVLLREQRDDLLDRVAVAMLEEGDGQFETVRALAGESLDQVEHLLLNHAEASR